MRTVVTGIAILGLVLVIVAGASVLGWRSVPGSATDTIRGNFKTNDASADSAPKQQVTADWAIKDGVLLAADQLEVIVSRLTTVVILLAAIALGALACAFGTLTTSLIHSAHDAAAPPVASPSNAGNTSGGATA